MPLVKDQTIEFAVDGRRYLLIYLGESPFDTQGMCETCPISLMSQALPHVHLLGELPVAHPDDSGANGASYSEYLRWLAAERVVAHGKRLATVSPQTANEVIRDFWNQELEKRTAEMR